MEAESFLRLSQKSALSITCDRRNYRNSRVWEVNPSVNITLQTASQVDIYYLQERVGAKPAPGYPRLVHGPLATNQQSGLSVLRLPIRQSEALVSLGSVFGPSNPPFCGNTILARKFSVLTGRLRSDRSPSLICRFVS